MEIASSSSRLQVATMENVSKVQLWMSLNCSFRVLKLGKCIFSCHCWWMREEVEVTDLAKCWKGRELEAPEKLSESQLWISCCSPCTEKFKARKCIRKSIWKSIRNGSQKYLFKNYPAIASTYLSLRCSIPHPIRWFNPTYTYSTGQFLRNSAIHRSKAE